MKTPSKIALTVLCAACMPFAPIAGQWTHDIMRTVYENAGMDPPLAKGLAEWVGGMTALGLVVVLIVAIVTVLVPKEMC